MDVSSIPYEVGRRRGRMLTHMADGLGLSTRQLIRYVTGRQVPPDDLVARAAAVLRQWDADSGVCDDIALSPNRAAGPVGYETGSPVGIQDDGGRL